MANFSFDKRYNIAPSQEVPVIVRNDGHNEAKVMKWGLVPYWAPDSSIGQRMINARSETLLEKPSFRQAVEKRRCLVPANGVCEWRREGTRKTPIWIQFKTREPFAFAGLWDCWIDRETGNPLYSFTNVTPHANALVRRIHDRMPVIYRREMGRQWLEETISGDLVLSLITQPPSSDELEAYEVSSLVNSPENDTPECVRRGRTPKGQLSFRSRSFEKERDIIYDTLADFIPELETFPRIGIQRPNPFSNS